MDKPITGMRREYSLQGLLERDAGDDPFKLFDTWFDAAVKHGGLEPNAMSLATVGADGHPTTRVVLLKGYDARGFVFYTNYLSRKAVEIDARPYVGLCFWWADLERQVRIDGPASKVTPAESDDYFTTRPRLTQLAAWASNQSEVVPDRDVLEHRMAQLEREYLGKPIPRPPHWGGYRVAPEVFEFWQGRNYRLHDRLRYRLGKNGTWVRERLSP